HIFYNQDLEERIESTSVLFERDIGSDHRILAAVIAVPITPTQGTKFATQGTKFARLNIRKIWDADNRLRYVEALTDTRELMEEAVRTTIQETQTGQRESISQKISTAAALFEGWLQSCAEAAVGIKRFTKRKAPRVMDDELRKLIHTRRVAHKKWRQAQGPT